MLSDCTTITASSHILKSFICNIRINTNECMCNIKIVSRTIPNPEIPSCSALVSRVLHPPLCFSSPWSASLPLSRWGLPGTGATLDYLSKAPHNWPDDYLLYWFGFAFYRCLSFHYPPRPCKGLPLGSMTSAISRTSKKVVFISINSLQESWKTCKLFSPV